MAELGVDESRPGPWAGIVQQLWAWGFQRLRPLHLQRGASWPHLGSAILSGRPDLLPTASWFGLDRMNTWAKPAQAGVGNPAKGEGFLGTIAGDVRERLERLQRCWRRAVSEETAPDDPHG